MADGKEGPRAGDHSVEVLTGPGARRRWSAADKAQIVTDSLAPGVGASEAARRWQVGRRQVYAWRREAQTGLLPQLSGTRAPEPAFLPIVAEATSPAVTPLCQPAASTSKIVVEIAGAVVRLRPGIDDGLLAAVLRAVRFLGSSSLGLQRSQVQQGKPVRMARACHQFPWAFALALGTSALS